MVRQALVKTRDDGSHSGKWIQQGTGKSQKSNNQARSRKRGGGKAGTLTKHGAVINRAEIIFGFRLKECF